MQALISNPVRRPPTRREPTHATGRAAWLGTSLLLAVIDEVDYGMLLIDGEARVVHANHVARTELTSGQAIHADDGALTARVPIQGEALAQALARAMDGQRSLLDMGTPDGLLTLAFVPLGQPGEYGPDVVLVLCGKRALCQSLSLRFFARNHGLTPAEEAVLVEVCKGADMELVASQLGVGVATVRTQLASIRRKTQSGNLRHLLQQLAVLPPLASRTRTG